MACQRFKDMRTTVNEWQRQSDHRHAGFALAERSNPGRTRMCPPPRNRARIICKLLWATGILREGSIRDRGGCVSACAN
eukprot:8813123-Alexandrium_andersonii.AAC.1